jgi:hypothetical protein
MQERKKFNGNQKEGVKKRSRGTRTNKFSAHPPLELEAGKLWNELMPLFDTEDEKVLPEFQCYIPPTNPKLGSRSGHYWYIRRQDFQGYVHVFLWQQVNGVPLDYRPRLKRVCPTRGCHNPAHYVESARSHPTPRPEGVRNSEKLDLLQYLPEDL